MTEPKAEPKTTSPTSNTASRIRKLFSQYEPPSMNAQILFWGLLISGLAVDLWSKQAVFERLPQIGDSTVVIDGFLNLVHVENDGAALGYAPVSHYSWLPRRLSR